MQPKRFKDLSVAPNLDVIRVRARHRSRIIVIIPPAELGPNKVDRAELSTLRMQPRDPIAPQHGMLDEVKVLRGSLCWP